MGIKISRQAFLETLGRVQPGIRTRATVEQSDSIVFRDAWMYTFSDEICCRAPSGLLESLEGAVKAKPLIDWVENIPDDEIEVWTEDALFRLRAGRKKAGIRMEAEIVLPIDEVSLPDHWTPLPEDFSRAVEQVKGAAGGANDEFMTQCVHIHPDYLEACDRRQATRYELPTGVSRSFLVRAESIGHVIPLGLTKIGETDDWCHFRNKQLIFSCRRHIEDYPTENITRLLSYRGAPATLPRGAEVAAKLAGIFTRDDKDNDKVTVNLTEGKMTVRGDGTFGWASEEVDMSYKGEPCSFCISPQLLVQIVKNANECEIGDHKLCVRGERWCWLSVLGSVEDPSAVPVVVGADEEEGDEDAEDE